LRRLGAMNEKRAALARRYHGLLETVEGVLPLGLPAHPMTHGWHLFIGRVDAEHAGIGRDDFMARLKERGIGTGLHFRAAHTHKYYREHLAPRLPLPNTEWNSARICSLPLFPDMELRDVDRVVHAIRAVLQER